jgi:hypothetical protein
MRIFTVVVEQDIAFTDEQIENFRIKIENDLDIKLTTEEIDDKVTQYLQDIAQKQGLLDIQKDIYDNIQVIED